MLGRGDRVVEGVEGSSDSDSQQKMGLEKTASPMAEVK